MQSKNSLILRKSVLIAVFSAIAYVVTLVIHIPVSFLTFDAKDAVITVLSLMLGPVSAVIMSAITAFIEFVSISGTGPWGLLMNVAASASFSATAALIYRKRRTQNGALISLGAAVLVMTAVMVAMNIFVTPIYMGAPREAVIQLLPTLLIPFNFAKGLLNAALTLLLYKPLAVTLRRARMLPASDLPGADSYRFDRKTLVTVGVGLVLAAAGVVIFLIIH